MSLYDLGGISQRNTLVTLKSIIQFIRYASLSRSFIAIYHTDSETTIPISLPSTICRILAGILGWPCSLVDEVWSTVCVDIWTMDDIEPTDREVRQYNQFALQEETSYNHTFPPYKTCPNASCASLATGIPPTLGEPRTHKATLISLRYGPLPIYTTSLYCRKCLSRYHSNYVVRGGLRIYYGGVPEVIQVAQHFFIETCLSELIVAGQVFGWISGTNWARIYNYAIAPRSPHIANNQAAFPAEYAQLCHPVYSEWQSSLVLRDEDVLNVFFLYSLLLDKAEHQTVLILPHDEPSQSDRLKSALQDRNQLMEGTGQEAYLHACDLCFQVQNANDGTITKIQAAVCDGITIGHPCCAVHDCKVPLESRSHRFCPIHRDRQAICAVEDCDAPIRGHSRTCDNPDHKSLEARYFSAGSSVSTLRSRLKRSGAIVPEDSIATSSLDDDHGSIEVDSLECGEKSGEGYSRRKLRACFGTNYTHTQLLFMRPCGVILSRATLFGSEAVSAINLVAKATFPTLDLTPEFLFFDNNCKLTAHQQAIGDKHFSKTAFPVDVFHFNTKHKETDTFCQRNCNPAAFPELLDANSKWRFNTSICEQTNVWLGGYMAILRNMEVTRFNFYLDEMIKRRNRYIISVGAANRPWVIPYQDVKHST